MPSRPLFFSLSSSFLPPSPFFVRVAAAAARQRNYLSADSWHKFPLSRSAWIGIASFFSTSSLFFLLSSFDIYHVSRRNERECVFRGIDASVAF